MSRLRNHVREVLRRVLTGSLAVPADSPALDDALVLETPREEGFGDLSSVAPMKLARYLRKPPRVIGQSIVDELKKSGELDAVFEKMEIAGAGFLNFTFRKEWVEAEAARAFADERLGVEPVEPKTVVIDFAAPNVAKPMHVGHLRSTILGDSLQRILRLVGHRVIGDNHLGDWGTQFGMIIHGMRSRGLVDRAASLSVDEIEKIYRDVNDRMEKDETVAQAARQEVVKLHAGDPESRRIWSEVMKTSLAELDETYRRLGITFDETLGESFYNSILPDVVADLMAKGIARTSEGAVAIFFEHDKYPPFLVRKSDGAFLYAATDLATVKYRMERWKPDWIIYVVDARQQLHLNQLFEASRMWGYRHVRFDHPWFGSVLGEDGRPIRTRAGETVRLSKLLDEVETKAMAVVEAKNPEFPPEKKKEIARVVGLGALKYADLCQNRTSDYVFSWAKMLALSGNTAPYMQYMYARVKSIFRKGEVDESALAGVKYLLDTPEELALAKSLIGFDEVVGLAASQLLPNFLTAYLYELAGRFSRFYDACPVLKAPTEELRLSRLMLCDHTAKVIRLGLDLLGIEVIEQM
jgi:arginyl-tRNA synthetase